MKILDRYIAKTLLVYSLSVMMIWSSIYVLFNFIDEIKFIGQKDYTATKAMAYVLSDLPAVVYSHSSVVILLGCLLALGHLASTSQIIIFRASGLSIMKIAKIVVRYAILFILVIITLGELVSPLTTQFAENFRAKALGSEVSSVSQEGFWIKDGSSVIKVKKNYDGRLFEDTLIIKLNDVNTISSILHSKDATFDGVNLNLGPGMEHIFLKKDNSNKIQFKEYEEHNENVSFDQGLLDSLKKEPYKLSIWSLYKQIVFLQDNGLSPKEFEVEFYKRIVKPATLIAMLLFSMLFIFGSLRDSSLGKKIFLGVMISLFFELSSRIGGVLSLRFDYDPMLSSSLPTIVVLMLAYLFLQRKSSK